VYRRARCYDLLICCIRSRAVIIEKERRNWTARRRQRVTKLPRLAAESNHDDEKAGVVTTTTSSRDECAAALRGIQRRHSFYDRRHFFQRQTDRQPRSDRSRVPTKVTAAKAETRECRHERSTITTTTNGKNEDDRLERHGSGQGTMPWTMRLYPCPSPLKRSSQAIATLLWYLRGRRR
jgi:hypothetical protein